jgi:hypothetical protein
MMRSTEVEVAKTSTHTEKTVSGCFLYAIVAGDIEGEEFELAGVDATTVYAISDGQVAEVVSSFPMQKVRPERRRLAAHNDVLKQLMRTHTVLPMVFGLIADNSSAMRRILERNRRFFLAQLDRFRDTVEMDVRVTWDVPNILEHLIGIHPDLKAFRDHVFRGVQEPSNDQKIELGRQFDRALTKDRHDQTQAITKSLAPYYTEIATNKPRHEREIANLAFLVDRGRIKEFETAVVNIAKQYDNHHAFDLNGPWPPHNLIAIDHKL